MPLTHADIVAEAERRGMPGRTLEQVQDGLGQAKENGADVALARLMLRFGRLQTAAREWVAREYPQ